MSFVFVLLKFNSKTLKDSIMFKKVFSFQVVYMTWYVSVTFDGCISIFLVSCLLLQISLLSLLLPLYNLRNYV